MKHDEKVLEALQIVTEKKKGSSLFTSLDIRTYRSLLRRQNPAFWQEAGAKKALRLFHAAADRVPAYKDFLKKSGVRHSSVTTIEDFSKVPVLTKQNYIQTYSLAERSWDGTLKGHSLLAMSSGTTGNPTIWPRGAYQEAEAAYIHEFLLTDLYEIDTHRTLMVVGFPMGIYVSGIATSVPLLLSALKHPNLSIVTAGNNKGSILPLLKTMQGQYEQIILVGHPFFIKDIIESGTSDGISWSESRVRTMFCSEGFNETWRNYIGTLLHVKPQDTLFSTYGSSEFLLMAFENPLTIEIRQLAENDEEVSKRIFTTPMVPSLFQYNPLSRFIETDKDDLVMTVASGIPLIRFNQHDMGNVIPYATMMKKMDKQIDKKEGGIKWRPWRLPFVTLYGRSDRTMIFYAANIYPEHIQVALNDKLYLKKLTGKFFMEKKYLSDMEQALVLHIEFCTGVGTDQAFATHVEQHIVDTLRHINLEYRDASNMLGLPKLRPTVVFHKNGDPTYFAPGLKPRFMA